MIRVVHPADRVFTAEEWEGEGQRKMLHMAAIVAMLIKTIFIFPTLHHVKFATKPAEQNAFTKKW